MIVYFDAKTILQKSTQVTEKCITKVPCHNIRSQNTAAAYKVGTVPPDYYTIDANDRSQPVEMDDDTWRLKHTVQFQDALHRCFASELAKTTKVSTEVKIEPTSPSRQRVSQKRAKTDRLKPDDFIDKRPNVAIVNIEPLTEPLSSLYDATSGRSDVNMKVASAAKKYSLSSIIRATAENDVNIAEKERRMHSLTTELDIAREKLRRLQS